jgi:hypothetical protein
MRQAECVSGLRRVLRATERGAERALHPTEDDMTTPRTRVIVSAVVSAIVSTIVTSVLAACGGGRASLASDDPAASVADAVATAVSPVIAFDNDARQHVQVYLVSEYRQWYLGRVEPGARRRLRVPDEAVATSPQRLQLAIMVGLPISPDVSGDARALFTIAQPAAHLFSQDWSVAQGQLISVPMGRARGVHP